MSDILPPGNLNNDCDVLPPPADVGALLITTVAGLPAAATAGAGARAFVTDATSSAFGLTVAGGGAINYPVYSDGTNWKIG
jgi:hypothetical protein